MSDSSNSTTVSYVYDVFGNLKSVVLPSKTVNYQVDAHNRRTTKLNGTTIEGYYLWNSNDQPVGLADASGALVARYVYGSKSHVPDYMILGSDEYQIISNHLGSPVVVINVGTGVIAQEVKYDEFGNILSDTNPCFTAFGFAGCLYDVDTKLCRFGARDYNASIGRWLSKDPILFAGGDTNLYGYVMQDPVNLIDPEGLYGYSPTAGDPVDSATGNALACFEKCVGQSLTVTGAKEGGHSKGSAHETGQACDLSEKKNPGIIDNPKNNQCFNQCFPKGSFGQYESIPPHLHLQTRPGKGGASGFRPKK